MEFPWISIPSYAEPGRPHAFANREHQLAALYQRLVQAGNAVRDGHDAVHTKHVVFGYMGVGKSALILQALGMIRGDLQGGARERITIPPNLVEPRDRQRWLIFRVSGKQHAGVDALATSLQRSIRKEEGDTDVGPRDPIFPMIQEISHQTERKVPRALELSIFHRLFSKDSKEDFENVRSALSTLSAAIKYVSEYQGATQTEKVEKTLHSENTRDAEAKLEAQLQGQIGVPNTREARSGLKLAANILAKGGASSKTTTQVERQWRISHDSVVDALNVFFRYTDKARLPTILVLDDVDEIVSSVGPSFEARARTLALVLDTFNRLCPTCLVIGIRAEYMHEDIRRQFTETPVPAMTRGSLALAIEAWAAAQQPNLDAEQTQKLAAMADRIVEGFPSDAEVVVPFRLLPIVEWMANAGIDRSRKLDDIVRQYLRERYMPDDVRVLSQLAEALTDGDLRHCVAGSPIDPAPYALTANTQSALERAGLLRPAIAGDPDDPRVVIDPLCGYLRHATGR